MPEETNNPCYVCNGTGEVEGEFCIACLGTGFRTITGQHAFFKELSDKLDDIMDKCNDIFEKVNG